MKNGNKFLNNRHFSDIFNDDISTIVEKRLATPMYINV